MTSQPVYDVPSQPVYDVPSQPVYDVPSQPVYDVPSQSVAVRELSFLAFLSPGCMRWRAYRPYLNASWPFTTRTIDQCNRINDINKMKKTDKIIKHLPPQFHFYTYMLGTTRACNGCHVIKNDSVTNSCLRPRSFTVRNFLAMSRMLT